MRIPYRCRSRNRITLKYSAPDECFVGEALQGLDEAVQGTTEYFQIEGTLPPLRCILVPDRGEFDRYVREVLKVEIETPSHPARVGMPQGMDLVLLSPRAYDARYWQYSAEGFLRLILHEVTHMAEEYLSPDIEATPRWWSEGLAVYISGHWEEETARVLGCVERGNIPRIEDMEADAAFSSNAVGLCYTWGWTVVLFVEHIHGPAAVRRIVKECRDGRVYQFIGQDLEEFENQWRAWLLGEGNRHIQDRRAS